MRTSEDLSLEYRIGSESFDSVTLNSERSSNKTYIVILSSGLKCIWKPHPFKWKREIAAYIFDSETGFNQVPATSVRKYESKIGTIQVFKTRTIPKSDEISIEVKKLKAFDFLLDVGDREIGRFKNCFWSNDELIAFDHENSFGTIICPNCHCHNPKEDPAILERNVFCVRCKHSWSISFESLRSEQIPDLETTIEFLSDESAIEIRGHLQAFEPNCCLWNKLKPLVHPAQLDGLLYRINRALQRKAKNRF
jgi:hypothetical protein